MSTAAMDFLSTAMPLIAISLAVVLATFVIIRSRARKSDADDEKKKKKYHPFVTNYVKTLANFSRLHHYMTEMAHKHKSYQAFNFFIDYVITQDPANIEYVLKTNFANYGKGWYHNGVLSDVLGDGIFAVDGEKWMHQRKVSSNELATKVAKQFSSEVYKATAVKLARRISEALGQKMEIQDIFMKATLDSIVKILIGIELDTLYGTNEEGTKFAHAFDVANAMTIYRYVDFSWKIRRFFNIGSEARLKKMVKTVDKFVYGLIKSKIDLVKNSPESVSSSSSSNSLPSN